MNSKTIIVFGKEHCIAVTAKINPFITKCFIRKDLAKSLGFTKANMKLQHQFYGTRKFIELKFFIDTKIQKDFFILSDEIESPILLPAMYEESISCIIPFNKIFYTENNIIPFNKLKRKSA